MSVGASAVARRPARKRSATNGSRSAAPAPHPHRLTVIVANGRRGGAQMGPPGEIDAGDRGRQATNEFDVLYKLCLERNAENRASHPILKAASIFRGRTKPAFLSSREVHQRQTGEPTDMLG